MPDARREGMTEPEDGEWLARRLIERCGCYPDRNECCDWCQGAAMVRRVCAQLAAAREDSARLDWLERQEFANIDKRPTLCRVFRFADEKYLAEHSTVRAAIDAAQKEGK